MKNTSSEDAADADMIADARFLYRELTAAIRAALQNIPKPVGDDTALKSWEEKIKSHHRQLQQVLNMEADIAKRTKSIGVPGAGSELDLDAAKREISERLARISAVRGDG